MYAILGIVCFVVFIICRIIFPKFFTVIHFNGVKGCLGKIIAMGMVSVTITACVPDSSTDKISKNEEAENGKAQTDNINIT